MSISSQLTLPKVFLFDWDATLADTYDLLESAHNHTLAHFGFPPRASGWLKPLFGMTREDSYQTIYGRSDAALDQVFMAYVRTHHVNKIKPMPGSEAVLKKLQNLGIPIGVVTNKRPPLVTEEIESFGWHPYLSTIVGAGEADQDKPSGAPIMLALERLGYNGSIQDVWFAGDSQTDQMAAKNSGCHFIAFNDGCMPPLDAQIYAPLYEFAQYGDLLSVLCNR